MGDNIVRALDGVSVDIHEGEFVSIMGSSGSGKSTLLYILGCLDRQTDGDFLYRGKELMKLHDKELSYFRNQEIGFIFQSFNLLMNASVRQNVELPLVYCHEKKRNYRKRIDMLLNAVGLFEKQNHTPLQLSGGQCQRVAIARALVNDPDMLLADEPTGNLDSKTGMEIIEIFQKLNEAGKTVIMVTHDKEVSQYSKRIVTVHDGLLLSDETVKDQMKAKSESLNQFDTKSIFSKKVEMGTKS
ncbi:ABC transporter ATP-binding protein [bacterium]|nr:ABC transporter ATP-binding protein [bacterium]